MKKRLTVAAKRKLILELLPQVAGNLGLSHWKITVGFGRLSAGTMAETSALSEYREMAITFDPWQLTADRLLVAVIHELLHGTLWPLSKIADQWADGHRDREDRVHDALEGITSDLSRILESCWSITTPEEISGTSE